MKLLCLMFALLSLSACAGSNSPSQSTSAETAAPAPLLLETTVWRLESAWQLSTVPTTGNSFTFTELELSNPPEGYQPIQYVFNATLGSGTTSQGNPYFTDSAQGFCQIYYYDSTKNLLYLGDTTQEDPSTHCPTVIDYSAAYTRIR